MASLTSSQILHFREAGISATRFTERQLTRTPARPMTSGRLDIAKIRVELKSNGKEGGGIGSRRRKRGLGRRDKLQVDDGRWPYLESYKRKFKEEGHQVLLDVETLLQRASNPFGLVLRIAEDSNEYLRNNKAESLKKKPILKVISDRINEASGEQIRDAYVQDHPDYSTYE